MRDKSIIIRADGREEEIVGEADINAIASSIGASCLDTVNLRDGWVMLVDDNGHSKGLPVNPKATQLYWSVCRPGTTNHIVGDVAVVYDDDFE